MAEVYGWEAGEMILSNLKGIFISENTKKEKTTQKQKQNKQKNPTICFPGQRLDFYFMVYYHYKTIKKKLA